MRVNFSHIFSWHFILVMQLLFNLVVILSHFSANFSITRQLIGFVYLTLVLGFIPAKLLNIDEHDASKFLVFSTGFSMAVLMFLGLLINEVLWVFGFSTPLSTYILMIGLNCFTFGTFLLSYFKKRERLKIRNHEIPLWAAALVFLPCLTIAGSFIINHGGNNFTLLLSIIAICVVAVISVIHLTRKPSSSLGPIVLFIIAISLFLQSSLVTNYIVGNDIYEEFYVFSMTRNQLYWNSSFTSELTSQGRVNAMLSVTMLPTIYSELLNMDENIVFKFLYPYILSWLVIGLYKLYSTQFSRKLSFLSAFFYSTNNVVFWLFSCRQIVAELFYVLLFILIIDKSLKSHTKKLCYIIFGGALVVSHYSMAYIFMFIASSIWLYDLLSRKPSNIKINQILMIFAFSFAWYIFTSSASAFEDFLNTMDYIFRNLLNDFFKPESREGQVIAALGGGEVYSLWNIFGRLFFYISEAFIVIGLIKLIIDRSKGKRLNRAYEAAVLLNFAIIMMCIVLPNFSRALQVSRFYQISLLFLSPLCIIGGKTIITLLSKRRKSVYTIFLMSLFQVPFFLFQSGFVYVITGSPTWSIPLTYYKGDFINPQLYNDITYEQEVVAAQWLRQQKPESSRHLIYADLLMLDHVLTAYGLFPPEIERRLTNTTTLVLGAYVYLGRLNTIKGIFGGYKGAVSWNISDFSRFETVNKIYSNGVSEVYHCNGLP